METHAPLPGITLGDIGPKMGFNQNDNGKAEYDDRVELMTMKKLIMSSFYAFDGHQASVVSKT